MAFGAGFPNRWLQDEGNFAEPTGNWKEKTIRELYKYKGVFYFSVYAG